MKQPITATSASNHNLQATCAALFRNRGSPQKWFVASSQFPSQFQTRTFSKNLSNPKSLKKDRPIHSYILMTTLSWPNATFPPPSPSHRSAWPASASRCHQKLQVPISIPIHQQQRRRAVTYRDQLIRLRRSPSQCNKAKWAKMFGSNSEALRIYRLPRPFGSCFAHRTQSESARFFWRL